MAEQDKSWQIKPKQDTTTLETEKSSLCGSLKPTDEEALLRNVFLNKTFGIFLFVFISWLKKNKHPVQHEPKSQPQQRYLDN